METPSAVISDIDGTLLPERESKFNPELISTISELYQNDILTTLSTEKQHKKASINGLPRAIRRQLVSPFAPIGFEGGVRITNREVNRNYFYVPLTSAEAAAYIDVLNTNNGFKYVLFAPEDPRAPLTFFLSKQFNDTDPIVADIKRKYLRVANFHVGAIDDLNRLIAEQNPGLITAKLYQEPMIAMPSAEGLNLNVFGKKDLQIKPEGVNKLTSLGPMLSKMQIPMDRILYAGDGANDHCILSNPNLKQGIIVGNNPALAGIVSIPGEKIISRVGDPNALIPELRGLIQAK